MAGPMEYFVQTWMGGGAAGRTIVAQHNLAPQQQQHRQRTAEQSPWGRRVSGRRRWSTCQRRGKGALAPVCLPRQLARLEATWHQLAHRCSAT